MTEIKTGDTVFIVILLENAPYPNKHLNINNYDVVKGRIIEKGRNIVTVQLMDEKIVNIESESCFLSHSDADQYRYRIVYDYFKNISIERITNDNATLLLPSFEPRITGNILRFGERNMIWNLPSWDDEITEEKIIQLIATTKEDIDMLINILQVIVFANDYAKKLIGKYIIIELNNIYTLLYGGKDNNGQKIKGGADKDSTILFSEYLSLWSKINIDFLEEYWEMFNNHLEEILSKYYPNEKMYYFLMPEEDKLRKNSELTNMAMQETLFPFDEEYKL